MTTTNILTCNRVANRYALSVALLALVSWASQVQAQLVIEPVINRFAVGDEGVPLADFMPHPGVVFSYVSGDPRDPDLDSVPVVNTTNYIMDGYKLSIIGTGTDTHDPSTIVRDASYAGRFGDVDGDGEILSDIFADYTISADGKTIEFTGGSILPGERFTGIHLATSPNAPNLAGIDSSYTGLDSRLCSIQGDPVAAAPFNLVDSFCIPAASSIGAPGGPATVAGGGTFRTNADGQLDVFIIGEPEQFGTSEGESFQYSSSLSWEANKPDAVVKEWVGNFALPDGPQAFMITNSSDPALTPGELTVNGTSSSVVDRVIPHAAFPPVPLGRYHIQVTGLDPFVDVAFSKSGVGAHVVPEPSSALLGTLSLLAFAFAGRGRRRQTS